jgi:uncharacterized repeat protein (TIGR01451 family)
MIAKSLVLAGALALAIATPAQYNKLDPGANNPPPTGAILDLSGTPIPGHGNRTYQNYTVNFTATLSSTAITFAFREDPSFIFFSNASVTDTANPGVELLVNGNFSQGTYLNNGNSLTPLGWTYANIFGAGAGGVVVPNCGVGADGQFGVGNCWDDGAVQAYDAISQTIATMPGHNYLISFWVADESGCGTEPVGAPCNFSDLSTNGDVTDTGGNGINVTVYALAGLPTGTNEGGTQTGTPINPDVPGSLTQTFHFGGAEGSGQVNDYTFDYSNANAQDTLTVQPGTTPIITDTQITPANWAGMVFGTPFATTVCIPITGANGNCASKKQVCTTTAIPTPLGSNCPQSSQTNILFSSVFDAPAFPPGTIFGATEATDDWTGGACTFPAGEPENGKSCPQNTLKSFTGPGQYTGRRGAESTNSTGVIYSNLIPPTTTVTGFVNQAGWSNSANPMGAFTGNPPQLPVPNPNNMTDPPVTSVTYGVDNLPADTPNLHPTDLPIAGDIVIPNPLPCPVTLNNTQQPSFGPNPVTLGPFADGSTHQLHYFTTDCATTEELKFTRDAAGNWSTNFNTLTVNVDLTKPVISSGPTLSPAPANNNGVPNSYLINQPVTVSYTCMDPLPLGGGLASGLATCNSSPVAGAPLSATYSNQPVATSAAGSFNYTVAGPMDVAGNVGLPASAPYTVVDQPVDLDVFYLAPSKVRPGANLTYFIAAVNLAQKNVASGVTITDIAPPGTTVVSAVFDKISCSPWGCSVPKQGTACLVSGNVITCNIGTLAPFNTLTGVGVVIVVKVPATMPLNTVLTDTASATSLNRDTDPKDSAVSITTIVKNY